MKSTPMATIPIAFSLCITGQSVVQMGSVVLREPGILAPLVLLGPHNRWLGVHVALGGSVYWNFKALRGECLPYVFRLEALYETPALSADLAENL
jgi:hypothetical protein